MKKAASSVRLALAVVIGGCAKAPPAPPPLPQPTFSFAKPEACKAAGSSKVTFAVVAPQWAPGTGGPTVTIANDNGATPLRTVYEEFGRALKDEFFALAGCKGFATKGPFASYGEMVFPERVGSDLVLVPELNVKLSVQAEPVAASMSGGEFLGAVFGQKSSGNLMVKGIATLSGRVTLAIAESVTNTRMWTKNIDIPAESFAFTGEDRFAGYASANIPPAVLNQTAMTDNGMVRALIPQLEKLYQRILSSAWSHLDAREMELVKKQSLEPRAKAGIAISK